MVGMEPVQRRRQVSSRPGPPVQRGKAAGIDFDDDDVSDAACWRQPARIVRRSRSVPWPMPMAIATTATTNAASTAASRTPTF